MELSVMRYKGFTFWCNPLSIEVQSKRNTAKYILPYKGEQCEDLGSACRVITGKGELKGEDCLEQYASLRALQLKEDYGVLTLPNAQPMNAYFTKLVVLANEAPDRVFYSFEFTESKALEDTKSLNLTHKVKADETLYDIAFDYGLSVDKLVLFNPQIRRPDELSEGEEVKLC